MRAAFAALREMAAGRAWPIVALSAAAWVLVIGFDHTVLVPYLCSSNAAAGWSGASALAATLSVNAWAGQALSWFVMLLAMMLPLLWQPLSHVWDRSLAERRKRAVVLFLGGYFGLWMLAVALLTLAAVALRIATGSAAIALTIAAGVAVLWQTTPLKARFLNSCHAIRPLPAFGLAAEFGSFRYGMQIAFPCIAACWAIMLLPLAGDAGHTIIMAIAAGWMLSERFSGTRPFDFFAWTRAFGSLVRNRQISRA
jgi:predicted metal-binding membrane protein